MIITPVNKIVFALYRLGICGLKNTIAVIVFLTSAVSTTGRAHVEGQYISLE